MRPVRIFVYEHITGGGCIGEALPHALLPQACAMLRALAADLRVLGHAEVIGLIDGRLTDALGDWEQRVIHDRATYEAQFDALVRESDATWLIAPETDRVLERLSARVLAGGKPLLSSRPHAVAIAASKFATARVLDAAGVPVIGTSRPSEAQIVGACVAKRDDGCGCEDTRRFAHLPAAQEWIARQTAPEHFVVQPYVIGEPISLSVLAAPAHTVLLSVNRQRVEVHDDVFSFAGCLVNAMADADGLLARLAQRTVVAIPGLWGYVGIDVLLTAQGPVVVEVNPRLTTSYAGLHAAIGVNPAELVLGLLDGREPPPMLALGRRAVEVHVGLDT